MSERASASFGGESPRKDDYHLYGNPLDRNALPGMTTMDAVGLLDEIDEALDSEMPQLLSTAPDSWEMAHANMAGTAERVLQALQKEN